MKYIYLLIMLLTNSCYTSSDINDAYVKGIKEGYYDMKLNVCQESYPFETYCVFCSGYPLYKEQCK